MTRGGSGGARATDGRTAPTDRLIDPGAVDEIVKELGRTRESVVPILQAIQERCNYLPEAALRRVCAASEITPASTTTDSMNDRSR